MNKLILSLVLACLAALLTLSILNRVLPPKIEGIRSEEDILNGIQLKRLKIKVEAFKKLETLEHDIILKHEKAIINETTGIQEDSTFIANAHSSELDSLRAIAFGQ